MLRIGTIGTSTITGKFLDKAKLVPEVLVTAIYSRTIDKARALGEKYGIEKFYDSLEDLAADKEVDAVYIASPNSLHHDQAILMMRAGKHVLCEKPMASNARETEEMFAVAKENNVVLLEAQRTMFDPAFLAVKENLPKLGVIRKGCLEYCQYSSRYDLLMQGQVTNIFDPAFSAGSLQDIGVYCVGTMVDLFGEPENTQGAGVMLPNGIDGCGTILASYPSKVIEVSYSKITRSDAPSQIQGEKGTIYIDPLPAPQKVWIIYTDGTREDIEVPQVNGNMNYEISFFANAVCGKADASYYEKVSVVTAEIIEKTRKQIGLVFPADGAEA